MADLTTRQLIDTIVRSLNENWDRQAEKYRGAAPNRPAPEPRRRDRPASGFGEDAAPGPRTTPRR